MKKILFLLILLFFPFQASSLENLSVVINEIAWMGTEESHSNEWMELYNNTSNNISIEGWKITTKSIEIPLSGEIPAKGFFLLERTDDETVPGKKADLIYTGALNNKGEYLILVNSDGEILDEIDCSFGWFAGDNKTKQAMRRRNPNLPGNDPQSWQVSQEEVLNSSTQEIYPLNIYINEILPSPEGPDAENEWIEIKNHNNFKVDLSEWQIKDGVGKIKVFVFPKKSFIESNGFLVLFRPESKVTLNNNGDSVTLLNPNGKTIDSVSFEKSLRGQSFNRLDSGWEWSSTLTPGKENKHKIIGKEIKAEVLPREKTQSLKQKIEYRSSFISIFITSLALALASGIAILFLKRKLLS